MKKYILVTFLSIALFQGFLFAEIASVPDSNTSQSPITELFDPIKEGFDPIKEGAILVSDYQDDDVLISFNRAYSEADKCYVTLQLKILANNKIIRLNHIGFGVEVLDNLGNDLQYVGIGNYSSDSLRPGDTELFRINFRIKPLENAKYLLLKIPSHSFGNINPFELRFEPVVSTEELYQRAESKHFREQLSAAMRKREENERLFIALLVVSLLVIAICIIWLLIRKGKIRKLFIKTLFCALYRPKVILWTGIFVIVAMCLFPPWADEGRIVGYAFLFSDGHFRQGYHKVQAHIYLVRLIIQCAIVGLITGALLYTLNDKKAEEGKK